MEESGLNLSFEVLVVFGGVMDFSGAGGSGKEYIQKFRC